MISFSRPCYNISRILSRRFQPKQFNRRWVTITKFSGIDKHNYLNKRSQKDLPNYLAVITLFVPLTAFGLAIWQYGRLRWKLTLVKDMELRMHIPAVELPEDVADRRKMEYRKVKVRGTFDHSKEMFIGPRSLIENNQLKKSKAFLLPSGEPEKPNIGYVVVTPFKLADRDLTILVNRGWVPFDHKNSETRLEAQVEGIVELEGIVRLKEDPPKYAKQGHGVNHMYRYRDIAYMAEESNSSFWFIDATDSSTIPGGPIGGQTQVNMKNDHLEYLLTWLLVGTLLGLMWHKRFIRKKM